MASSVTAWNHSATSTSTSPLAAAAAMARHFSASAATDLPTWGTSRCKRTNKNKARVRHRPANGRRTKKTRAELGGAARRDLCLRLFSYVDVVRVEGVGEDAAVERPLVAVEADEAVALELAHDGVRLVAVERLRAREEDLADQLRLRHRQARRRPEPDQEGRPCTCGQRRRSINQTIAN